MNNLDNTFAALLTQLAIVSPDYDPCCLELVSETKVDMETGTQTTRVRLEYKEA